MVGKEESQKLALLERNRNHLDERPGDQALPEVDEKPSQNLPALLGEKISETGEIMQSSCYSEGGNW